MERDSSLLMVGEVFEYRAENTNRVFQHIGYIADQLLKLGLVANINGHEPIVTEASVRRTTDPEGKVRYVARIAEWSEYDSYNLPGKQVHVYVGKDISEGHGTANSATIEDAFNEVEGDFPNAGVMHCTKRNVGIFKKFLGLGW